VRWPWKKPKPADPVKAAVRELARRSKTDLARAVLASTQEVDHVLDLLTGQLTEASSETANPYNTREKRIEQLVKMYDGEANWGGGLLFRLMNIRKAAQLPYGLKIKAVDGVGDADDEVAFIQAAIDRNNLAEGKAQELVKQKEFEGQVLIQIKWEPSELRVIWRLRLWRAMKYDVTLGNAGDESGPKRAKFTEDGEIIETLEDDEFAFVCFGADGQTLEGNADVGHVIWYCENLDKAIYGMRKLNNLFAHPTPFFKCEDAATAKAVRTLIKEIGWKVGMAIAANADLKFVGPFDQSVEWLETEASSCIKRIAAIAGVPVYELGMPELMSNRATADATGETDDAVLAADITTWRGFFEDLFAKTIRLRNIHMHVELREDVVQADIQPSSDRMWTRVEKIFLPGAEKGLYSRRTLHEKTPDIDPEEEGKRLADDDGQRAANSMAAFGADARDAIGE